MSLDSNNVLHNLKLHAGLLFLRLGLGALVFYHGLASLKAGTQAWLSAGEVMMTLGFKFAFAQPIWGLSVAFVEFFGGIAIVLGVIFRPSCLFLAFVTLFPSAVYLSKGAKMMTHYYPIGLGILFLGLALTGAGKIAIGKTDYQKPSP